MTSSSSRASFLTLPLELRLQVYRNMFTANNMMDWQAIDILSIGDDLGTRQDYHWLWHTAIMQANRTIHEEASDVFYGERVFVLTIVSLVDIKAVLEMMGKDNCKRIRELVITCRVESLDHSPPPWIDIANLLEDYFGVGQNGKQSALRLLSLYTDYD